MIKSPEKKTEKARRVIITNIKHQKLENLLKKIKHSLPTLAATETVHQLLMRTLMSQVLKIKIYT